MAETRKRELIREYKERKVRQGVFAVRCAANAGVWVSASRNLDTQQNGIWFQLKLGNHPNKALQAAWNDAGAERFGFEVLEEIDNENKLLIPELLKERTAHWLETLGAAKLAG
jgi:hypothetical protein